MMKVAVAWLRESVPMSSVAIVSMKMMRRSKFTVACLMCNYALLPLGSEPCNDPCRVNASIDRWD